jgi:4a-hydroxytetrahydrobiopterin dehydratase
LVFLQFKGGEAMPDIKALTKMKCVPCRGGEPTVTDLEIKGFHPQVSEWEIVERNNIKRLKRVFRFKNFRQALEFTNKIGDMAEKEGHHPVIVTEWGRVKVSWWTHKIKGLHQNDFIMAAKTDELYSA